MMFSQESRKEAQAGEGGLGFSASYDVGVFIIYSGA
jgi:hypothetical protein